MDDLEDQVNGTGWNFDTPGTDEGPLVFNHEDGSETSMISSSVTGGYAVEYEPADGATEAVTDQHVSFADLGNGVEWLEHVLSRHEEVN